MCNGSVDILGRRKLPWVCTARYLAGDGPASSAFTEMMIQPRLAEFSAACVPLREVVEFYDLSRTMVRDDRPYVWR